MAGAAFNSCEDDMAVVEDTGPCRDRKRGGDVLLHDRDGPAGPRRLLAHGREIAHDDRRRPSRGPSSRSIFGGADQCACDRQPATQRPGGAAVAARGRGAGTFHGRQGSRHPHRVSGGRVRALPADRRHDGRQAAGRRPRPPLSRGIVGQHGGRFRVEEDESGGRSSGSGCAARQRKLTLGLRRAPRSRGGALPQDGQLRPKR